MGKARIITPPPLDYITEPLVTPVIEITLEEEITSWTDGTLQEEVLEIENNEPSQEEIERERIAQEKYEELQRKKLFAEEESKVAAETIARAKEILENPPVKIETVIETVTETVHVTDPKLVEELQTLKAVNEKLTRENEAAAKAKEDQIIKMRQQATDQKGSQLNMVQARKPTLLSRIKAFFKQRRIQLATVPRANYEQAIIHQASVAVPMMLDTIEKMHESLTVLEELLAKHKERQKINQSEKHPRQ